MNIQIIGRHLEITEEMRAYAAERGERLFRYFERILKVQITLSSKASSKTPKYGVEMVVTGPKSMRLVAEATDTLLNAAVDKVTDKIERQITRHKEKMLAHRRETGAREEQAAPEEGDAGDGTTAAAG